MLILLLMKGRRLRILFLEMDVEDCFHRISGQLGLVLLIIPTAYGLRVRFLLLIALAHNRSVDPLAGR